MQVHELCVVVHAVQNFRVDRLGDVRVKIRGLFDGPIRMQQTHVHLVAILVVVQRLTQRIALHWVRVPEARQLRSLGWRFRTRHCGRLDAKRVRTAPEKEVASASSASRAVATAEFVRAPPDRWASLPELVSLYVRGDGCGWVASPSSFPHADEFGRIPW